MSWQSVGLNAIFRLVKWRIGGMNYEKGRDFMLRSMDQRAERAPIPPHVQREVLTVGGVPCELISVDATRDSPRTIIYFHGGAFAVGCPATHRDLAWRLSAASGMKVLLVDYRRTPEHVFPAPVEDAESVYRALLAQGHAPGQLALAGDSAGGNLVIALQLVLREAGLPMPAAAIAVSPWADLSHSGASFAANARHDPMVSQALLINCAEVYAGLQDRKQPKLSPVFADMRGFAPLQIHVGSSEILLDDARRLARNAREAGVPVDYREWKNQPHAFPVMAAMLPEARQAIDEMGAFLQVQLRGH